MKKGLEYLIWRIEAQYYEKNKDVLSRECMNKEKLDCNCITGLIINYAAYLLKLYLNDTEQVVKFAVDEDSFYVRTEYENKELFPVKIQDDMKDFYYADKICKKIKGIGTQARFPFRECKDEKTLKMLKNKHKAYAKQIVLSIGIPECYMVEFWIRFLEAMRMADAKTSESAFLMMALFMFQDDTLGVILDEVQKGAFSQDEIEHLVVFLHEYIQFLVKIESDEKFGFFSRFSKAFEDSVGVNIAELIEDIISRVAEHIIYQSFTMTYRDNMVKIASITTEEEGLLTVIRCQELSECAAKKIEEIEATIAKIKKDSIENEEYTA